MTLPCIQTAVSRYSAVKWRFFLADILLTAVLFCVFQLALARPCIEIASKISGNFYAAAFVYGSLFLSFLYLASFPLRFADSFYAEHAFGLSLQKFSAWITDEAKSAVLSFVLWACCIQVFYLVIRNFPTYWWLVTAVLWLIFSVVMARFLPILLIPLFFKYMPIENASMKERIVKLAEKAGIDLVDVCQIDLSRKTRKANAALVGLGKTRKVIMGDTLMREFSQDEAEAVVAHEFGHYKFRHILQLLAVSGVVTVAGFFALSVVVDDIARIMGASGPEDLYILPALVFLMLFFGMMIMPLQNWFSRKLEREADRYAIEMTGSPETFISVMKKLAAMNLSDPDPPLIRKIILYNHPPISERIRMAEDMRRSRGRE